jgi:Fe-S oxidoreductase
MFGKVRWLVNALYKADFATKRQVIKNFLTAKRRYVPKKGKVDSILKCALCPNMCRFDCPITKVEKSEAASPAGKMRIAYLMETGKLNFAEDAIDLMYKDLDCDACRQWCPFGFSVGDLLVKVKEDIAEKGLAPERIVKIQERLKKDHTIYENGITSLGGERKKADLLYFAGCTTLNRGKKVADATIGVLEAAGVDFTTLPEEWCCGAPLYSLGFREAFDEFAIHNLRSFKEMGCKTIVCSCPDCVYTFRKLYPKNRYEVRHISQLLAELVEKVGPLELDGELVFHDPCILSRKLDIYKEPREVLNAISKLNLKEADFNEKDTRCCGRGGMLGITNPSASLEIAKSRAAELGKISNFVISACPACEAALKEQGLKVMDISEVVFKGMRDGGR